MSPKAEKILEEALDLPDSARADLAAALLDSLDLEMDEEVEAAWSVEILRRIQEVESGAVKPIPWDEARRMIFESRDEAKRR
ncbi:MAG: addiction module protein [Vicinamibacteria bacterium]